MNRLALGFACAAFAAPVAGHAHPHIFIDTGFEVILDSANRATHVRVTWDYDEFYSLLIAEDLQIDQDFDGVLTAADLDKLVGFDMKWVEGYLGDLYLSLAGQALVLSGPTEPTATIRDGRIVTTHLRAIAEAPDLAQGTLSIKAYDPTFYTAYDVTLPVRVSGPAVCMIDRVDPDIDGQMAEIQRRLAQLGPNEDPEDADIPLISGAFAADIRIACPAT